MVVVVVVLRPPSHLTLCGGFAGDRGGGGGGDGGPAGVRQAVLGVAVQGRGGGRGGGGQCADGGALRLRLLLQQLLRLPVVQGGAGGLQGDGVGPHAGVEPAGHPRRLQLLQVLPVELLTGQQTHPFHDADLLLGVAPVHAPLAEHTGCTVVSEIAVRLSVAERLFLRTPLQA